MSKCLGESSGRVALTMQKVFVFPEGGSSTGWVPKRHNQASNGKGYLSPWRALSIMAVCLQVTSTFEEGNRSGMQWLVSISSHFGGAICDAQMIALLCTLFAGFMSHRVHPFPLALGCQVFTYTTVSIHAVGALKDWARTWLSINAPGAEGFDLQGAPQSSAPKTGPIAMLSMGSLQSHAAIGSEMGPQNVQVRFSVSHHAWIPR